MRRWRRQQRFAMKARNIARLMKCVQPMRGQLFVCARHEKMAHAAKTFGRKPTHKRPHAAARGYDWQWQQFREQFLNEPENALCWDCLKENRTTATTDVHHIKKLSEHPELKFDRANLMPLCSGCHDKR